MDSRIIEARLEGLSARCIIAHRRVENVRLKLADFLAPGTYQDAGRWTSLTERPHWPAGKTVFVEFELDVAGDDCRQLKSYLFFDGTAWEGHLSFKNSPYAGIDGNHRRLSLDTLLTNADVNKPIKLQAEFISVPRVLCEPDLKDTFSLLRGIFFEIEDPELRKAEREFQFAWRAVQVMPDEYRKLRIRPVLEKALRAVDFMKTGDDFRRDVVNAKKVFRTEMEDIKLDPERPRVFLTGHSHIDVAWLWPLSEAVRKCARTFSTACRLLEMDDEYRFSCSQPQLYEYTKNHYPDLYSEIKTWVALGRWETTGGMWVESDCNVPSGESLIRQVLLGIEFFKNEFGKRPKTCWLPDVFGYPATLPQILGGCGLTGFYTNKLHWQAENLFPNNLFWWEGTDGTQILAHVPKLKRYYNGSPEPEQLLFAVENFAQMAVYDEVLLPFGHGDGGGGPTEEMVAHARIAKDFPGLPACRTGAEEEYFDRVEGNGPELPVWRGELYLETHRGTLTSQATTKTNNRRCETLLRQAEILSLMARHDQDSGSTLKELWKSLLLLQFHDILPGSSIGRVYDEAAEDYRRIGGGARTAIHGAINSLTAEGPDNALVVFNTLSWERNDIVVLDIPRIDQSLGLAWSDGSVTALQWTEDKNPESGGRYITASPGLAPLGFAEVVVKGRAKPPANAIAVTESTLDNAFFRIELNDRGELIGLYDKREGREVLLPNTPGNRLHLFQDGPEREAAWNVHDSFELREYEFEGNTSVMADEGGPVRGSVLVIRRHRGTTIYQRISVYESLPRIDFITEVHWNERQVLLKAEFPVAVRSDVATYEIQCGVVQRPTHRNTSWDKAKFEVPMHRWVDLSEHGYGVSLMNDGKYGCDVKDNVIRLTLLRGPEYPDPQADLGVHRFTYSLFPHAGPWQDADTVRRAWELNEPVLVSAPGRTATRAGTSAARLLVIEGPVVLSAAKAAEDSDGWILRVYEPHGSRGLVRISGLQQIQQVKPCNHVEENLGDSSIGEVTLLPDHDGFVFAILPFQIRSFRINQPF
ncbi:MAG: alpha-mannosidase [Spirochaetales bacterium]|nr:alpha-mannosidase [Spirochaetales bacterium]